MPNTPKAHHSRPPLPDTLDIPREVLDYIDVFTDPRRMFSDPSAMPTPDEVKEWQGQRKLFGHLRSKYNQNSE